MVAIFSVAVTLPCSPTTSLTGRTYIFTEGMASTSVGKETVISESATEGRG